MLSYNLHYFICGITYKIGSLVNSIILINLYNFLLQRKVLYSSDVCEVKYHGSAEGEVDAEFCFL